MEDNPYAIYEQIDEAKEELAASGSFEIERDSDDDNGPPEN